MKRYFIDTNLIVNANDRINAVKQRKALQIINQLIENGNGVLSTQVIQEYANTALNKLKQDNDAVLRQMMLLEKMEVITISPSMIRRGIEIRAIHGISFWDSIIISAAEYANCSTILSEDLNNGQLYMGMIVKNPFLAEIEIV